MEGGFLAPSSAHRIGIAMATRSWHVLSVVALTAAGCSSSAPSPSPKQSGDPRSGYTAIDPQHLTDEIGWGGPDAFGAMFVGMGNYKRRCASYDGRRYLTDVGILEARGTAETLIRGYVEMGDQRIPITNRRLQTQPPGTARPFGRSLWVDASEAPNLLTDIVSHCQLGNICNYTIAGHVKFDPTHTGERTDADAVNTCMLVVDRYRFIGENGMVTTIAKSAALQAVQEHAGDIVDSLNPGR